MVQSGEVSATTFPFSGVVACKVANRRREGHQPPLRGSPVSCFRFNPSEIASRHGPDCTLQHAASVSNRQLDSSTRKEVSRLSWMASLVSKSSEYPSPNASHSQKSCKYKKKSAIVLTPVFKHRHNTQMLTPLVDTHSGHTALLKGCAGARFVLFGRLVADVEAVVCPGSPSTPILASASTPPSSWRATERRQGILP